ncbi:MAG: uridine kinase [Symbiobacterium thermophilum]|uniref:Uridine kinase n=1 Tax=Symbiobacterium thermophilum TaxID=2734 RepID=A0A1Y2T7Q4_SYMTR|nr:MAG: uridine kinase [Symbiobacterium thermophilum]PZN73393.1 MAG: uridine kinase [Bacillota bacterium]
MPVPRAVIAIAGGTGSGKTSIANYISAAFPDDVAVLPHDAYYKDNRHLTYEERSQLNYDHPDAFDNDLFIAHLKALKAGQAVERPVYNFSTHLREPRTVRVEPAAIIVVEGVLVLAHPELRALYDLSVYVDTDADVRILRRIVRDIRERGRTLDSVIHQYLTTVKPMHEAFVEPSKRYANVIIPEGAHNKAGLEVLIAQVRHLIAQRDPSA